MNRYILFFFGLCIFGLAAAPVAAQCDPNIESPIKCGYYNEGYQYGVRDAQANRSSDYRRHRDRFSRQYESYFRNGYQNGYDSVRPIDRWTNSQRSAYDSGYTIGQSDRRQGGRNTSSANSSRYDANIGLYFQQGYNDGFSGRPRRYDVPIGGGGIDPPVGGGTTGTAVWEGRVDDRGNVVLRGNSIYTENVSGNGINTTHQNVNGFLPRRSTSVTVRKRDGRGNVSVIQQPNRSNNFAAVIQISDSRGGSGSYKIEITWSGPANVEEPYSAGSVSWRGRVDQKANIIISGSYVQTEDASGSGLSGVTHNLNGVLARRPGRVNVRKQNGRGTVTVLQQPTWENDFTAIVQVFDPDSGSDNYEVEIRW